jgi:hypothetical protein
MGFLIQCHLIDITKRFKSYLYCIISKYLLKVTKTSQSSNYSSYQGKLNVIFHTFVDHAFHQLIKQNYSYQLSVCFRLQYVQLFVILNVGLTFG